MRLTDDVTAILVAIGRRLVANPQPKRERLFAPRFRMLAAGFLHRANERGRALELLNRQQTQGITHDHGKPTAGVQSTKIPLKPSDSHCERSYTEVRLGLSAARGEP